MSPSHGVHEREAYEADESHGGGSEREQEARAIRAVHAFEDARKYMPPIEPSMHAKYLSMRVSANLSMSP